MGTPVQVGAVLQYAQALFGGELNEQLSAVTIATTQTVAVDYNGDRVVLVFINTGSNDVLLLPDNSVSSINGIRIGGLGGALIMDVTKDFTLLSRRWYALSPGGGSTIWVLEVFRITITPKGGQ